MCLPTSHAAFLLFLFPQGTEPEEADLPADSLLRPLWPTRVYLGAAQKACLLNTPPTRPDTSTQAKSSQLCQQLGHFLIGKTWAKVRNISALRKWTGRFCSSWRTCHGTMQRTSQFPIPQIYKTTIYWCFINKYYQILQGNTTATKITSTPLEVDIFTSKLWQFLSLISMLYRNNPGALFFY